MTAITLPKPASVGQTHTAAGFTWIFDGVCWAAALQWTSVTRKREKPPVALDARTPSADCSWIAARPAPARSGVARSGKAGRGRGAARQG
jgi:hypothetical protein